MNITITESRAHKVTLKRRFDFGTFFRDVLVAIFGLAVVSAVAKRVRKAVVSIAALSVIEVIARRLRNIRAPYAR